MHIRNKTVKFTQYYVHICPALGVVRMVEVHVAIPEVEVDIPKGFLNNFVLAKCPQHNIMR